MGALTSIATGTFESEVSPTVEFAAMGSRFALATPTRHPASISKRRMHQRRPHCMAES